MPITKALKVAEENRAKMVDFKFVDFMGEIGRASCRERV